MFYGEAVFLNETDWDYLCKSPCVTHRTHIERTSNPDQTHIKRTQLWVLSAFDVRLICDFSAFS